MYCINSATGHKSRNKSFSRVNKHVKKRFEQEYVFDIRALLLHKYSFPFHPSGMDPSMILQSPFNLRATA